VSHCWSAPDCQSAHHTIPDHQQTIGQHITLYQTTGQHITLYQTTNRPSVSTSHYTRPASDHRSANYIHCTDLSKQSCL